MKQQVNLVEHLDLALPDAVNIKLAARLCGVAVTLILVYYAVINLQINRVESQIVALTEDQETLDVELGSAKIQLQALQNDAQLLPQIDRLKKQKGQKSRILNSVAEQPSDRSHGFSAYLRALGERPPEGLWFTRLWFEDNGRKLSWTGQTRRPESLPRYIQQLKSHNVYVGHFFNVLKMRRVDESGKLLQFEISSKVAEP